MVAADGDRVMLVGEAKWTREPVGFGVLNHLREVVRHVPGATAETHLALFGRQFDSRLVAAASAEGVLLVSPAHLYGDASHEAAGTS